MEEVESVVNQSTISTVMLPHWRPKLNGRARLLQKVRKVGADLTPEGSAMIEKALLLDPANQNTQVTRAKKCTKND